MSLQAKLRQLFLLDQQVRGIRTRLDAATRRLDAQQAKLGQLTRQHAELTDQLKQAQVKANAAEKQSQDAEAKVARLREQMNSVKNNKEYSALLIEVNTLKTDKGKLEEEALGFMGQFESLTKDMSALDAKVNDQKTLVAAAQNEVDASRAEVGRQLDELTAKRDAAAADVPADVRVLFNRTAAMHEGEAMAPVVEENRRNMEYSCGGCYMGIPVERVNALMMTSSEQIIVCPSCQRILYVEEELRMSMRSK